MGDGYTDRFGYPLTAAQSAARLNRGRGFFDKYGRWVRLPAKKPDKETPNVRGI